jgi:glycogen(starch) synthase
MQAPDPLSGACGVLCCGGPPEPAQRPAVASSAVRVALVSWEYPPLVVGGLAAAVDGLSRGLARRGHDVVVLTLHHPDAPEFEQLPSPAGRLRVVRARTELPWLPEDDLVARMASANHQLLVAAERLEGWQAEVVHAHDWLVAWTGDGLRARWRVPLVATVHATEKGRNSGTIHPGRSSAINAVEWWLTYQAREVICCSAYMAREVVDAFTLPPDKVHLVPNGVDAARWAAPPAPPTPSTPSTRPDEGPLVVAWGRVEYEKGFQTLLLALGRLRHRRQDIRVVIAGKGSYLDDLQDLARRLGVADRVRFAGFVPDDELVGLLHRADVAVVPSLYEPFGIVALEALAAGTPVVASATGGLAEVLDGTGAAELFTPGDPDGLAAALERALDPEVRAPAVAQGRALVAERYDWTTVADATVAVYDRALRTQAVHRTVT